ncbi:hypothetical protein Lal_00017674 [Lupinus albus]|nr:hypothetical protein Lal_00017674 [Lupinus albus]
MRYPWGGYHDTHSHSGAIFTGFEVKEKELKELKADTMVRDIALNESLEKKLEGKEIVFVVEITTKTGVEMSGWKSWKIDVTVLCGDKSLQQLEARDTPNCTLTTLKWV